MIIKRNYLAIFILIASVLLFSGIFFISAGKILSFPDSKPKKSDIIIVLGGDSEFRSPKALELYKKGFAPNVLFIGLTEPTKVFRSSGIIKGNIIYDTKSKNSWDEAVNTFALMKEKGWVSAIVVSDPPHLLRVRYAWGKVFKKSGMKFTLVATEPDWWNAKRWWKNDISRRYVISEYLKLGYFIYKYNILDRRRPTADRRLKIDEKEHERLRQIEKKWENKIDGWLGYFIRAIDRRPLTADRRPTKQTK